MSEMFDDLKELKAMLENGEITLSEYDRLKADLLAEKDAAPKEPVNLMSGQPAGWYFDPSGSAPNQAYWDGNAWTGKTRPRPIPTPQALGPKPGLSDRLKELWQDKASRAVLIIGGIIVAAFVILVGNSVVNNTSSSGEGSAASGSASPPAVTSRCSSASVSLLNEIGSFLTVTGGGTLRDGQKVRSNDYEKVWFVAAEIDGSGMEDRGDIGIWASNESDASALIMSVDGMAKEFSDWIYGPDTDFQLSQFDDGAQEAKVCQETR